MNHAWVKYAGRWGRDWQKKQIDFIVIFIAIKRTQMYRNLVFNTYEMDCKMFFGRLDDLFCVCFSVAYFSLRIYLQPSLLFFFFFIKSYSVILKATDEPSFFFKLANCVSDNIIVSDIIYICNESFYHNSPRHKHSSPELVPGPNYWCFFSLFLIHLLAWVLSSLSQI